MDKINLPKNTVVRKKSGKPFKSGSKIATVKGMVEHPFKPGGGDAYVFEEDESCVDVNMVTEIKTDVKLDLISFPTAKLANDKGFQLFYDAFELEYDRRGYTINGELIPMPQRAGSVENIYEAPTQELLKKWLFTKHNIKISIDSGTKNMLGEWVDWYTSVNQVMVIDHIDGCDTPEEALEEALVHALKLIK